MNREDIIRMAREAKQYAEYVTPQGLEWFDSYNEHFAVLVASATQAKEREECAKVCDEFNFGQAPIMIQKAIRARGNT